ncbi:MAG: DUF6508 domain-containing protein [Treponemataceae bacterium]|nr:DUF6508 domain-containing protein [Treponemataceae bacterium]
MINSQELDSVIEYLQNNSKVECNPYPNYEAEIYKALDMLKTDRKYLSHHAKLGRKPIEEMNKKEIATMLTFISRGERFCDGHIASYVESGTLLRLMLRLREII